MKLIRFTVRNHRSIRDTQTLDMAPKLGSRNRPAQGKTWEDELETSAIIFGPNASGKSNLIDALGFAIEAIRSSATSWRDSPYFPHFPFELRDAASIFPSRYEFDFISSNDERYLYGFEIDARGVREEWLRRVAKIRWSTCFHRIVDEEGDDTEWNDSFISKTEQNALGNYQQTELILSAAYRNNIRPLSIIASEIFQTSIIRSGSGSVSSRVDSIVTSLINGKISRSDLLEMLRAADFGIKNITVNEAKIPKEAFDVLQKFIEAVESSSEHKLPPARPSEISDVVYNLVFKHVGENGKPYELRFIDESDGTQAWISVAPRIIDVLRQGGIFVADELDASLHQSLIEMIIQLFTNDINNPHGAQIILSTHNTNILEHRSELGLTSDCFWFVEKDLEGATELYDLTGFKTPPDANLERRYLNHRFGALPKTQPSALRGLILNAPPIIETNHEE